jgi:hypothetical protein
MRQLLATFLLCVPLAAQQINSSRADSGATAEVVTEAQPITPAARKTSYPNDFLPSNMPFKCVEAYLSVDKIHGGTDYGAAITAAVQASSLTSPTQLKVCSSGDHPIYTTGVFDRPIAFHMDGQSRLIPQASLSSAQVVVDGATATAGSFNVTVPSSAGLAVNMAVWGVGIPPGAYVTAVAETAVTISLPANVQFYGIATSHSANIAGVSSMSGLAVGQTLNGVSTWPFISGTTKVRGIDYVSNIVTASTAAISGSPVPTTFVVGGSWTTNLTFVKTTPVLSFIYNSNALHNNFGQMYGSSMHQVWIQDTSGLSPQGPNHTNLPGMPGITGVQIAGYDQFSSYDLHVEDVRGACEILGGVGDESYVGGYFSSVRESSFFGDQIRNCGDAKTGQAALVIMTPRESNNPNADEINEINFSAGRYIYSNGPAINIGTYNNGHTGNRGPGLIFFSTDTQIEGWSVNADIPAQSDSIVIQRANDIHLEHCELAVPGQGKALIRADTVFYLGVDDCNLYPSGSTSTYQIALTKGSAIGVYISGGGREGKFNTTQTWDGMGVLIGSISIHLAPLSPISSDGTILTLASPWAGSSGTFTMTAGYGGVYTESSQSLGHMIYNANNWTPLDSESLSLIGNPSITDIFYVGAAFMENSAFTQDSFDRRRFTVGPTQYGSYGFTVDTSLQGTFQAWDKNQGTGAGAGIDGETDIINVKGGGTGGLCFFNTSVNSTLSAPRACITGTGGLNISDGIKFKGTTGFTGTKTSGSCVFTIQGGIITNVTGC